MKTIAYVLSATIACGGAAFGQNTLVVHSAEPGAYRTVQAAIDAAAPGDRILLAEHRAEGFGIDKSVTIESRGSQRYELGMTASWNSSQVRHFEVRALTPGQPLILRNLRLALIEMAGSGIAFGTPQYVPGEIRLVDVDIEYRVDRSGGGYGGTWVADVDTDRLWLRGCRLLGGDMGEQAACIDRNGNDGVSCLKVRCNLLTMEDCDLDAGRALFLLPTLSCGSYGPWLQGGRGGTALQAATQTTVMTRVRLHDGNGGGYQAAPASSWPGGFPYPGPAGSSTLVGQGGTLLAYDTLLETGLPGAPTANTVPDPQRGPVLQVGDPFAHLTLADDPRPGGALLATVPLFAQEAAILVLAPGWQPSSTPLGTVAVPSSGPYLLQRIHPPLTQDWPIPAFPALRGVPLTGQVFYLQAGRWLVGNPSGTWIGW